ncbi:MAG: DUF362 domain-containing protein [Candidatus Thorarchaeota archaeon]|jgi:uncharacterized Fe-S center protein
MSSEPSKVFFGSVQHGNPSRFASFAAKVDEIIKKLDFKTITPKDKVAVKMHLGFHDGYQTVPVFFVRRIVDAIKKRGAFPFVTDNPTAVYNAVYRGYTQETCGCPIIPITGIKDGYAIETKINFKNVKTLSLSGVLKDADVLIDLSHTKGHNNCGYGGAIKNIALGGFSGKSRWHKIHGVEASIPFWDADKCTPEHAKKLVAACPDEYISYDEEKHKLSISFGMCNQCMDCIEADKDVSCLKIRPKNFALFQELMAIGSNEILKTFDEDKRFFFNFMLNITAVCDCWGIGLPPVVNDIGVLGSRDIVAIEKATLDLIAKEGLIKSKIPPFYRNVNLDPEADLHPFSRIHGPMKNPYLVLDYAEKLGMGTKDYKLVEVLSPKKTLKMKPPKGVSEAAPTFY